MISEAPELHQKAIDRIRAGKGPINVIFFAIFDSVWKYDELYRLMEADERFNPVILVCPVVNYGEENMRRNMQACYSLFKSRGYNVIKAIDDQTGEYVDVRRDLDVDVIFYTNPYKGLIDDRYYIDKFTDILTCYSNYYFGGEDKDTFYQYQMLLSNLLWRKYIESGFYWKIAEQYAPAKTRNIRIVGYSGIDKYIKPIYHPKDVWKIKDRKIKRFIWAPHHTISDYTIVYYSTFLSYFDFMFEIAEKYKDRIQICFKPHPLLKNRLEIEWGKEKTELYYRKWKDLENGDLNDGSYEDLFLTSDAILHDCGSFIFEYLVTGKPAMHLSNGIPYSEQYNDLAQEALSNYYIAKDKEDIERFINMIIDGKDDKKERRLRFVKDYLTPPNGKLASENIIDDLVKELRPDSLGKNE